MRIHHLLLLITLGFVVSACHPDPPGAGTEGHACRSWPKSACDEGLNCKNEICTPCGAPGQDCCTVAGGSPTCQAGLACEGTWGEQNVCQSDCGLPGLPCCPDDFSGGYCPDGVCDYTTNLCEGQAVDPCFAGPNPYTVAVLNANCAVTDLTFFVHTASDAEACRQQWIAAAPEGVEICKLGQLPEDSAVCKISSVDGSTDQLYFPHCSDAQLKLCEYNHCFDCDWLEGACPEN